jgi:hypothetical protein
MEQDTGNASFTDLIVIWVGTILGHFTLSDAVLWATLFFTIFRTYVLLRDEVFRKKP